MPGQPVAKAPDAVDRELISLLVQDGRRTAADMAAAVHLSATAVARRLKRLEDDGVIIRYSAQINYAKLGYGVEALLELRFAGTSSVDEMTQAIARIPDVVSVYMTSGDYDLVAVVRVESVAHLRDVLRTVRAMPDVIGTRTHLVMDSYEGQSSVAWDMRAPQ